jgi:pimeloyl-ACP methyl ester carboxylesterase
MTEPLLLLPGMMCDARLFGPQVAAFARDRDVLNGDITGAADMETLAGQVLAAAPDSFALAGLSMGGIVAMEVIRQAPERVTRLALLDTNPRAELPEVKARRAPQIEAVRAGGLERVMREELKPKYLTRGPRYTEILDLCMAMALDLGPEVFERQSIALRDRPDQQDTLRGVRVPTLILCGREDVLCPVERHELMHGLIAGSRLVIVEEAGHLPTLERPEAVSRAMANWLAA